MGEGGLNKDVYRLFRNGFSNMIIEFALLMHRINHVKLKKNHDFIIEGGVSLSAGGRHLSQIHVIILHVYKCIGFTQTDVFQRAMSVISSF